jgi:two-component system chemotaxis response regulator CheB
MNDAAARNPAKIVVIGGSQGAIEALLEIVATLPASLSAALFVVIHLPVEANSYLPNILSRAGALRASHPAHREAIRAGKIYVAPPNHHLTLARGEVHVSRGPRENRHRPAIDPLFRTAARVFGRKVIAVLLSGNLDDGSAGLFAVRSRGGVALVQNPEDAQAGDMPERALAYAGADYTLPARDIGPKIIELLNSREPVMRKTKGKNSKKNEPENDVRENEEVFFSEQGNGKPSVFACPECHGVLWELQEGKLGGSAAESATAIRLTH